MTTHTKPSAERDDAAVMPDPTPWRHVSGARVADIYADDSPIGGYTYDPRPGYSDYPERYISTRSAEHAARMARADAQARGEAL